MAPNMGDFVYEIAVPSSPTGSPPARGKNNPYVVYGGSDERERRYYDDRSRLAAGPVREHRRAASVHIETRHRDRSRPRSTQYHRGYKDYYADGDPEFYPDSDYSGSSHGSREHSRDRFHRHTRPSSAHSDAGYDYAPYPTGVPYGPPPPPPPPPHHMGHPMALAMAPNPQLHPHGQALISPGSMVPWQPPVNPETEELNKKIAELQSKIKSSEEESKRIQKQKEQEEEAKKKTQELKALVEKELEARRMAEQKAKEAEAAKKREVEEEARKLLEQQEEKLKQEKQKALEENAKIEAAVNARLGVDEKMKLDLRKPTHTKFSKIHLCKEALDEKGISYTESVSPASHLTADSFLTHS